MDRFIRKNVKSLKYQFFHEGRYLQKCVQKNPDLEDLKITEYLQVEERSLALLERIGNTNEVTLQTG